MRQVNQSERGSVLIETAIAFPLMIILFAGAVNFMPTILQSNLFSGTSNSAAKNMVFDCNTGDPDEVFNSVKQNNNLFRNEQYLTEGSTSKWAGENLSDVVSTYNGVGVTLVRYRINKSNGFCLFCNSYFPQLQNSVTSMGLYPRPRSC